MARAPNQNSPIRLALVLVFQPHELRTMKWNERSAAGNLGGWPSLENQILSLADRWYWRLEIDMRAEVRSWLLGLDNEAFVVELEKTDELMRAGQAALH